MTDSTDPRLVEAMLDPAFYPEPPQTVELVQTHISYIFLAGDFVYKVKKPVDFGFLDFTTLARRKFYCEEEMRLNRRLAPDAYLAVLPIGEDGEGRLCLSPPGGGRAPVEYALKMIRLPGERMLKHLLPRGEVDAGVMRAIARKVAAFHSRADTGGQVDEIGGPASVRHNLLENFEQTEPFIGLTLPAWQHRFLSAYNEQFFKRHLPLLERRVDEHRIRDCHGDLHLEHICLTGPGGPAPDGPGGPAPDGPGGPASDGPESDGITIFDCIEFNQRFRYGDVGLEVAFLAMDLDFNGYHQLAAVFVDEYVRVSGDSELPRLLNFFACYRAYVRGKVIGFRLNDPAISRQDRQEAAATAARYFDLAFSYAAKLERPTLLLVGGLMGTGKSLLSRNIAGPLGAEVLQMDVIRKELAGIPLGEHHFDEFGAGLYSADVNRRTYDEAVARAQGLLEEGRSVIIDASWSRRADRVRAAAAARRAGADLFFLRARAADEVVKERLERRLGVGGEASDGRWEIYEAQKTAFEPAAADEAGFALELDCSAPPADCAVRAICAIRAPGAYGPQARTDRA